MEVLLQLSASKNALLRIEARSQNKYFITLEEHDVTMTIQKLAGKWICLRYTKYFFLDWVAAIGAFIDEHQEELAIHSIDHLA